MNKIFRRYYIALSGSDIDLDAVMSVYKGSNIEITQQETGYFLYTDSFKLEENDRIDLDSSNNEVYLDDNYFIVRRKAEELVDIINSVLRFVDKNYQSIHPVGIESFTGDMKWLGTASCGSQQAPRTVSTRRAGDKNLIELIKSWTDVAVSNEKVRDVIYAYTNLSLSWSLLYYIYETIEYDLKKNKIDLIKCNWIGKEDLNRFKQSAQVARNPKEGPRHGGMITNRPANPLTLEAANLFIKQLICLWIKKMHGG